MVVLADVQVAEQGKKKKYWMQVQVSRDPAASYKPYNWTKEKEAFPHLKDIPVKPPIGDRGVDLMIGMDTPNLICSLVPDIGGTERSQPVARLTRLGWTVGGPSAMGARGEQQRQAMMTAWSPEETDNKTEWVTHIFKATTEDARDLPRVGKSRDEELMKMLARMWELDDRKPTKINLQDEEIFQYLRKEIGLHEGKYLLPTLWKTEPPQLMNNYEYANKRLAALLQSKQMTERVKELYDNQIKDWRETGYVEIVHTTTPEKDNSYYLPHFAVVKWDKTSTQVRIVMDGAAKYGKRPCLNDCVKKGPKLVNELTTVLLRFRHREVCIAADIKKCSSKLK